MRKLLPLLLLLALLPISASAASAPKPGSACAKLNQTRIVNDVSYKCKKATKAQQKKSKSKFVWGKGVVTSSGPAKPINPGSTTPELPANPTKAISPVSDLLPVARCQISQDPAGGGQIRAGFPRHPDMVRSSSKIVVQLIYVDFPDLNDKAEPKADIPFWTDGIGKFFDAMSGDTVKFEWRYENRYFRLPNSVMSYGLTRAAGGDGTKFVQAAIDVSDSVIDFTGVDFVVAVMPPNVTRAQADVSPAFILSKRSPFRTNEGLVYLGTMAAGDTRFAEGYLLLVHEFGHLLGIQDYYWYGYQPSMKYEEQFKFMGQFDNMNFAPGDSREWTAWSRWLIDFLPSNQVRCVDGSKPTTHQLTTIATKTTEPQLLVIPTSNTTAIAIESRRNIRFDSKAKEISNGLLVYQIDTSKRSGYGPVEVVRKATVKDPFYADAPLKPGESVTIAGYTITNLEAGKLWDVAEVKKN